MKRCCGMCGTEFEARPSAVKQGEARWCSPACFHRSLTRDPVENFWSNVKKGDGCWEWQGSRYKRSGYGYMSFGKHYGKRKVRAHRYSYELHFGPLLKSECVLHTCDNPGCVRPDHLKKGSTQANTADRDAKHRQARGERNGNAKLTTQAVSRMRLRHADGASYATLAREFGVSDSLVDYVVRRLVWAHVE